MTIAEESAKEKTPSLVYENPTSSNNKEENEFKNEKSSHSSNFKSLKKQKDLAKRPLFMVNKASSAAKSTLSPLITKTLNPKSLSFPVQM